MDEYFSGPMLLPCAGILPVQGSPWKSEAWDESIYRDVVVMTILWSESQN